MPSTWNCAHEWPEIRRAIPAETSVVSEILSEAAVWADSRGTKMWQLDELSPARLTVDVATGLFLLAWDGGTAAGTVKFQLDDPEFWPDDPGDHAAYIHRLAVRRRYAGTGVSTALMTWAVERTRTLGRHALRLDADVERTALRRVYEQFGFRYHSERRFGPYLVARYELKI
jgi:GNAT superfamily N-acetyltransferase